MFIEETLELNSTNMNRNIIDGLENILEPRYLCQSHEIHIFKCPTYSNQLCLCLSNWHMNGPNLDNYHMITMKCICIICKGLMSHLVRQVILGITRTVLGQPKQQVDVTQADDGDIQSESIEGQLSKGSHC